MIIILLLSIPLIGILFISTKMYYYNSPIFKGDALFTQQQSILNTDTSLQDWSNKYLKSAALKTSILTLSLSFIIFIVFDFSTNQFQFVQEYHEISSFNLYLGMDGLSIYFVLLTTIIMPISLLSNWTSISHNVKSCFL